MEETIHKLEILQDNDDAQDFINNALSEFADEFHGFDEANDSVSGAPMAAVCAVIAQPIDDASDRGALRSMSGHTVDGIADRYYGDLYETPYVSKSGNRYPGRWYTRTAPISRVILHHMANGASNITDYTLLKVAKNRVGSWTYTVMSDGEIIQWLPENVAPWTTSSYDADNCAITVEIENISGAPTWAISDKAYKSVIRLLADIARRYPNIGKYKFDGSKGGSNIHFHEWYASTNCPGQYLKNKIKTGELIDDANRAIETQSKSGNAVDRLKDIAPKDNGVHKVGNVYILYRNGQPVTEHGEHCIGGFWYYVGKDGTAKVNGDAYVRHPDGDKWCRYNNDGKMIYGFNTNENGIYYFDMVTGAMAKGDVQMLGNLWHFDEITGVLVSIKNG